jgi:hypothetical protein
LHNQFYLLMQGYARLVGLNDVGRVIDGHPIKVNDVLFSLVFDPKKDPTVLFIYGDLGVFSVSHRQEEEGVLLASNMMFYPDFGACVSVSPVNDQAILCLKAALADLTPELLHQRLLSAVDLVKEWRGRQH